MTIDRWRGLAAALLLLVSGWAHADGAFRDIYVFGDSLSDTGNLASVVGPLPPPFFMNRISNGPVAVETLAALLGLDADASLHLVGPEVGGNYAVAGGNALGDDPEDLQSQLLLFLANNAYVAPADALYVILIGGNDVRGTRSMTDRAAVRGVIRAAAASVGATIDALAQAGAQKFLIVNAPDVSLIPETALVAAATGDAGIFKRARRASKQYRREINRVAKRFDGDDDADEVEVVVFDLFRFFARLLRKAEKFGFSNTTDPCFFTSVPAFNPDCNFGANFDEFIFFDEIHPSARVHAIVGDAMYELVADEFDLDNDYDEDEEDDEGDDDYEGDD